MRCIKDGNDGVKNYGMCVPLTQNVLGDQTNAIRRV